MTLVLLPAKRPRPENAGETIENVGEWQYIVRGVAENATSAQQFAVGRTDYRGPAAKNLVAAVALIARAADFILASENIAQGATQIAGGAAKNAGAAAEFAVGCTH